jgi:hypothetical protein
MTVGAQRSNTASGVSIGGGPPALRRAGVAATYLATDTGGMATPPQKGRLSPQPRRAIELLELLSSSPHGATETLLVRAHGFNSDMISGLVHDGLATAQRETMKAGAKPIEVVRVRITDNGRKAIEE